MRKQWLAAAVVAASLSSVGAQAGDLKFSGKVFTDFTYKQNVDDGTHATSKDSGTGLDLKRFYLTADYTYDDLLSARFRTDVGDQNGKLDVFVKHAYVQLKLAPELWVRAGAADLPWVPFVEDRYGFRYVENVLLDRTGFGTSADWGVHAGGDFAQGLVSYQVSVVNGRGYADPSRSQAPTVEARVSTQPVKNLFVAVGGQMGTLGQKLPGTPVANTAARAQALVAWAGPHLHLGAEGFYGKNDTKTAVTKGPEDSALGVSGWASYEFVAPLRPALFGRFDYVQPSKDLNADLKDTYFNAGVQVTPWAPLQLALVYKRDHVATGAAEGAYKTSNGVIGSGSPDSGGTYNEVGVWAQLNF